MKRSCRILAVLIVAVMIMALVPATLADTVATATVLNATVLRAGPSDSDEKICVIPRGATVELETTSGAWYKAIYNSSKGYVYYRDVTVSGSVISSSTEVTSSATASAGSSSTDASSASSTNGTMSAGCNFRTGPGTSYSQVSGCTTVPKGAAVTVLAKSGSWYKITYKTYTGYVSSKYCTVTGSISSETASSVDTTTTTTTTTTTATTSGSSTGIGTGVTTGSINFRTDASTSASTVSGCAKIAKGKSVTILSVSRDNKWYNVYYNGYTGWIYAQYCKVTSATNSDGSTTNAQKYAAYSGKLGSASDRWGTITVSGTGINQNIYCNAISSKGVFYYNSYNSSYNYVYALSYLTDNIAVIYGHNMRKTAKNGGSLLGLHELHHVQNAWLGVSKCEYCGKSCASAKTSVFNINYNGSTQWQLVAFYEVNKTNTPSSSTRKSIELYNSFNSTLSGNSLTSWLSTQLSYAQKSGMHGAVLGSISASDKVMMLATCADSSGDSNQRLYMLLKAVG